MGAPIIQDIVETATRFSTCGSNPAPGLPESRRRRPLDREILLFFDYELQKQCDDIQIDRFNKMPTEMVSKIYIKLDVIEDYVIVKLPQ